MKKTQYLIDIWDQEDYNHIIEISTFLISEYKEKFSKIIEDIIPVNHRTVKRNDELVQKESNRLLIFCLCYEMVEKYGKKLNNLNHYVSILTTLFMGQLISSIINDDIVDNKLLNVMIKKMNIQHSNYLISGTFIEDRMVEQYSNLILKSKKIAGAPNKYRDDTSITNLNTIKNVYIELLNFRINIEKSVYSYESYAGSNMYSIVDSLSIQYQSLTENFINELDCLLMCFINPKYLNYE